MPQPIPAGLLHCPDQPPVPDGAEKDIGIAMGYATDVATSGENCRFRLREVGKLVKPE